MASTSVGQLDKCLREKIESLTGFGTPQDQARKLEQIFRKYDTNRSGAIDSAEFVEALRGLNFIDCNVEALFDKYDLDHTDTIEYKEFAEVFFGLRRPSPACNPNSKSAIANLRAKIAERGGMNGIRTLGRLFRIMDDNGNHALTAEELQTGMADFGLQMSNNQIKEVINAFDKNRDGLIDFNEFLRGIRNTMSNRRRDLVLMAYDVLDTTDDGNVTIDDLIGTYDVSQNPEVQQGVITPQEALEEFMSQWDTLEKDGEVSREEFLEYYKDVSASIDSDDYFELMIRNAWHISGGEGDYENTANLRVLATFSDGSQRVVEVKEDLGLDKSDKDAIIARLARQGLTNVVDVKTAS